MSTRSRGVRPRALAACTPDPLYSLTVNATLGSALARTPIAMAARTAVTTHLEIAIIFWYESVSLAPVNPTTLSISTKCRNKPTLLFMFFRNEDPVEMCPQHIRWKNGNHHYDNRLPISKLYVPLRLYITIAERFAWYPNCCRRREKPRIIFGCERQTRRRRPNQGLTRDPGSSHSRDAEKRARGASRRGRPPDFFS